ncbi:carbohydrate ABC transporter permease, partial [Streptomyces sp. NPDC006356]
MAAVTTTTTTVRPVRRRFSPGRAAAWAVMGLIVLITLLPFYWILRTALSTNAGLSADPTDPLPVDLTGTGFQRALGLQSAEQAVAQGGAGGGLDFWRYLLNSVIVSTLITGCQIFFSAMAAYA